MFQKGWGHAVVGLQHTATIEPWLPLFLFAVLFGLSMDYHVFLLSRTRERYEETQNNPYAVTFGLRTTGKLITGAALIMVAGTSTERTRVASSSTAMASSKPIC